MRASGECLLIVISLGGESCRGFKLNDVKYGWWSENLSIRISGEDFRDISETLQTKLSIRVPVLSVNLVGKVISGKIRSSIFVLYI